MEEDKMTEDYNNTQNLLGKLEVKMDNIKESNESLKTQFSDDVKGMNGKLDEVVKDVNNLKLDITDIKARQPVAAARVSGWVITGICITAGGTLSAVLAGLFIIIPKFAGL